MPVQLTAERRQRVWSVLYLALDEHLNPVGMVRQEEVHGRISDWLLDNSRQVKPVDIKPIRTQEQQ